MDPRHSADDLAQYQSLSLESKIELTKMRIEAWHDAWTRFEIYDKATGKTRFATIDTRDVAAEPHMKDTEWIVSAYPGQVYVSFSGGKDSTVLKHIVDSMYPDIPALFVNTGLEYPDIQGFVRDVKAGNWDCFNPDVQILRPEMRFDEVIKKYGYPVGSKRIALNIEYGRKARNHGNIQKYQEYIFGRRLGKKDGKEYKFMPVPSQLMPLVDADIKISNRCCDVMKKKPLHKYQAETGRKAIIATMACESKQRADGWMKTGCNAFESKEPKSKPLSFWTEQDILHYIKKYDVPYCKVYGDIRVKPHGVDVPDNQIDIVDYLGCYEPEDTLETTGCKRTGCMFCMFGCHLEKEPNRFQRLKQTHPRHYEFCIGGGEMVDGMWQPNKKGLGIGHVLDYINVKY